MKAPATSWRVPPPWQKQPGCGCEQGAAGLLIGVAGYLTYLWVRPAGWADAGWTELWIGCGIVFLTTSAGKVAGIVVARHVNSHTR